MHLNRFWSKRPPGPSFVLVLCSAIVSKKLSAAIVVALAPAPALALAAPVAVAPNVIVAVTDDAAEATSFLNTRNALASKERSGCFSQGAAQPTAITSSPRRAYALLGDASDSHPMPRKRLPPSHWLTQFAKAIGIARLPRPIRPRLPCSMDLRHKPTQRPQPNQRRSFHTCDQLQHDRTCRPP